MADRAFRNEIRRLVDGQVPEAPWLEDRVMAAVLKDAAGRNARRFDGSRSRLVIALAAAIIAVLAVVVLVGTRLAVHPTPAPVTKPSPSRDAAVLRYQALINSDARPISTGAGWVCRSNQQCIALANQTRAALEVLLHDVDSTTPPTSLAPVAAQLKTAAQEYIAELDSYIAAEQDPNTNYLAPTGPIPNNFEIAVATVDCWPGVPDVAGGVQSLGNGGGYYNCIPAPG
jgi:hypothetical protein